MFRFFVALAAIILVIMAGLVSVFLYSIRSEVADIRFTVHAEFLDGETPYVGSGVWELHIEQGRFLASSFGGGVRGEAIQLHGDGQRNLFVMRREMDAPSGGSYPMECGDDTSRTNIEFIIKLREEFTGPCTIDRNPMLVEIDVLADPSTARVVRYTRHPEGQCEGLCLRSFWIERTDAPVTIGIERLLPWLPKLNSGNSEIVTGKKIVGIGPPFTTLRLRDFSSEID